MSYPSDYDDDDRPTEGSSRPTPAGPRPAWDAATYGRPDDRPFSYHRPIARDRAATGDHRYGDGVSADPLYSTGSSSADTYSSDTYSSDTSSSDAHSSGPRGRPYAADPYPPRPYPEAYRADAHPADRYPADPYAADPYPPDHYPGPYHAEPYPADPYPAGSDAAPAYPIAPPSGPATSPFGPYPSEVYPGARYPDDGGPKRSSAMGARPTDPTTMTPAAPRSRAGRNLPAAIGIGVLLGAAVLASLFLWRPAFLGVLVIAVGVGCWELVRAIRLSGANPPLVPLIAGGALMAGLAWWGHGDGLTFGLIVTVLAVMVWRLADGPGDYGRDVTAATLIAVYLPFLAGFAALLAAPADGDLRVLVMLAGVVLSDTGGYVAGVLFGQHPMAPSVSPKKSWEGLAGSLVAAAVGGALLLYFLFEVPLWLGAVFGLAVSAVAVLGDLGESMLKRDLGVKDMSNLLPGHGGLMDRLDSIVFAAPTAYLLLILMAPPI
jgi:phosphatidate cytidylyltransferase